MRLVLVLLLTATVCRLAAAGSRAVASSTARSSGPAPIWYASTSPPRVNGDEPVTDLQAGDFEVTEDDVPQTVETIKFVRVDGTRTSNLDEPLEIRSKQHAMLEAAREDVRLFAIFLDDYHIDKRPDITLPLRETLTKFIKQLGSQRSRGA